MNASKQPPATRHYSEAAMEMVDSIYAYASGRASLLAALNQYLDLIGDVQGGIFYQDPILEEVRPMAVREAGWQLVERYKQAHGEWNPLFKQGVDRMLAGDIITTEELISFEELTRTDYYKEVLAPVNMRHSMACLVAGRGQAWSSLASVRADGDGEYTQEHYRHADLFRNHMARAMHIVELTGESGLSPGIFESILGNLPVGLLLVDDNLQVLACNDRARSHLAGETRIKDRDGRLLVGGTRHQMETFNAWWQVLVSDPASDGARYRSPELEPLWEVEASRVNLNNSSGDGERHWLLTLKEIPGVDQQMLSVPYLRQRFHLSEAEAQVCVNLCRSGDAVSTAAIMGLSPHTVRAHLKNAFRKTGTRNQVQLALKLTTYLY